LIFNKFDLDHNGTIDAYEFQNLINELGENMDDKEIEIIFKKIDANGKIPHNKFTFR
jgi:Ca2+-binding EF-hand superfamily protein